MTAVHDAVSPLTALGIKSSYQNEADPFEENWQEGAATFAFFFFFLKKCANHLSTPAFFGYKYAELSAIKQKYDPDNCELIPGLLRGMILTDSDSLHNIQSKPLPCDLSDLLYSLCSPGCRFCDRSSYIPMLREQRAGVAPAK